MNSNMQEKRAQATIGDERLYHPSGSKVLLRERCAPASKLKNWDAVHQVYQGVDSMPDGQMRHDPAIPVHLQRALALHNLAVPHGQRVVLYRETCCHMSAFHREVKGRDALVELPRLRYLLHNELVELHLPDTKLVGNDQVLRLPSHHEAILPNNVFDSRRVGEHRLRLRGFHVGQCRRSTFSFWRLTKNHCVGIEHGVRHDAVW